jgi:hypothetical protein
MVTLLRARNACLDTGLISVVTHIAIFLVELVNENIRAGAFREADISFWGDRIILHKIQWYPHHFGKLPDCF